MTTNAPPLRAAVVQMTSGDDVAANRATAERLVRRAAGMGAALVVLPEKWNLLHDTGPTLAAAEPLDGPTLTGVRSLAAELGIAIHAGSVTERIPGDDRRTFNTTALVGPDGTDLAVYRKIHLFDVSVGGHTYRESDFSAAGEDLGCADVAGLRLGLTICYDLRFPELYRALVDLGATALAVPAAFTAATGKDHWEPLLRARAIENQCFVLAAGQYGEHANGTRSHGRSMIVDPWGVVLAQAADGEGVACADLDLAAQARIREQLPALRHRRPDRYGS